MKTFREPNHPIVLSETQIVDIDGQPVRSPARAVLRLSPRLGLAIESEDLPPSILKKKDFEIELENGARMTVCVGSYSLGEHIKGALVPRFQPCEVIRTREPILSVEFSVLNFREFLGQNDQWIEADGTMQRLGFATLEAGPWIIRVTAVANLSEAIKTLTADGGRTITHTGVIERPNGGAYSVRDVEELLSGLRTFLSFARGTSCGITNVKGKDRHGNHCWVRWGSHHTAPWNSIQSWLIKVGGGDVLSCVFSGFWRVFTKDRVWQNSILQSIDWYLNSNESAMHVGIILTQAALERLSHQILGKKKKGGKTGEFTGAALEELNLELQIPSSCSKLKTLQQDNKWDTGPHALVEIRNALVHPKNRHGSASLGILHDSWNLGQWYIELMLLKLFGYRGHYRNRLSGHVEHVPWDRSG